MSKVERYFVVYYSPGSFFNETNEREIDEWDIEEAENMAKTIKQRYNATPFGFRFVTNRFNEETFAKEKVKESAMYFLGGEIKTLKEVKREMPDKKILISNMESNHINKVIVNDNSWRVILPFDEDDILLKGTIND